MAIKLANLPPTEFGAKLNFNSNEDLRVVYRPSEQVPDSYEFHDLWYPEQDYPDGYVAVPFGSAYRQTVDFKSGTKFANVERSSKDPIPYVQEAGKCDSWRQLMEKLIPEWNTCCAQRDIIYKSKSTQLIPGFKCTNHGVENEDEEIWIHGSHVLMNQTASFVPYFNEPLYIVPLCANHNTYDGVTGVFGTGYYMKLGRDQTAIELIHFIPSYVINDAILKEELK